MHLLPRLGSRAITTSPCRRLAPSGWLLTGSLILLTVVLATPRATAQPVMYTVHGLGGIPGGPGTAASLSNGAAINASGQVAGFAYDANGNSIPFRVAPGGLITDPGALLGILGGSGLGEADGINASGQVIGSSYNASGAQVFFRTTATGNLSTATLLQGEPFAINDAGQVAGAANFPGNAGQHAARTAPNGNFDPSTDLGTFGGTVSQALGISPSGQVTGHSYLAGNGALDFFLTTATGTLSTAEDLTALSGGAITGAVAPNASGQIAGTANGHAFRSNVNDLPLLQDLGTLGGATSSAIAINSLGVVFRDKHHQQWCPRLLRLRQRDARMHGPGRLVDWHRQRHQRRGPNRWSGVVSGRPKSSCGAHTGGSAGAVRSGVGRCDIDWWLPGAAAASAPFQSPGEPVGTGRLAFQTSSSVTDSLPRRSVCAPGAAALLPCRRFFKPGESYHATSLSTWIVENCLAFPPTVEFVCVVGAFGLTGDGMVRADCQWTRDLQAQGIPAVQLHTSHVTAMRSKVVAAKLADLIRDPQPRWSPAQVEAAKAKIIGKE